ncbi:MAG TPA: DUF1549 domain-containing protein [Pirellulales bacterium]|nr:DUF1549 domain-containing protein [Pirellulales bacterium]
MWWHLLLAPCAAAILALGLPAERLSAAEPLHQAIDRLIAAQAAGEVGPLAGDAEFLRRAYLDLAGKIPAADEARAFLADPATDKRAKLIDRLLESPDFPRRMQDLFHAMLLERRGDDPHWLDYLRRSFEANKPWDVLAREILDPDPQDEAVRGAAYFYVSRLDKVGQQDTDYPGLTRDVGRLFLGVDLQCAQCHNHLFIDDYKQQDFQGLYAVFLNTFIRRDVKFPAVGENLLTKKTEFMSVFDKVPLATGPRIPGGAEIEIPAFAAGEEYRVPPDKQANQPGEPKFSPLEAIAARVATAENAAFSRNIANRLWFVMFGRGLVHPLDLFHRENPPSHPELLELLAQDIAARKFDMRGMLRELALSETYQRSGLLPAAGEAPPPASYRVALEKPLSAEQLFWSMLTAAGTPAAAPPGNEQPGDEKAGKTELDELRKRFVAAFANPPKEPEIEFSPSVKAALFVMNDPRVLGLLEARPGNLVDRLSELAGPREVADELYLSVLTRLPTDEERADMAAALAERPDRRAAVLGQMAWALVASTEFCLNH